MDFRSDISVGSDTTSTSMAATLHYLSFSPLAYKKAAEEVRRCFTNLEEIRMGPLLNSCTYLRACIDEALRMSPPGGGPLWREVYKGGALIDGMHIQEGVDVAVGIHSIHHNPEYFPEPYSYNPDRWLKTINGTEELEKMRSAYMPFGLGPRSCVGKPLALVELMLTMATFLWQFDFRASNRDEVAWADGTMAAEQFHLKDHVTGQKDGPLIEFRLRDLSGNWE
jgi:cytochrome P450